MSQLEKDEIEDVTDEMLDRLIKDGKTVAVLFCKIINFFKRLTDCYTIVLANNRQMVNVIQLIIHNP